MSQQAREIEEFISTLYGTSGIERDGGVIHVAAVWRRLDEYFVLRIGPESPKSETDLFALALSRARADSIITTGQILRDEPDLRYDIPTDTDRLLTWRREVIERPEPASVIVLTRGSTIDFDHPCFHSWARPIVFTEEEPATRLRRRAPAHVRVVGVSHPSLRAAVEWAQTETGARTVTVEAGPSSSVELYQAPSPIDELMLSVFTGATVPPAAQGLPFISATQIDREFEDLSIGRAVIEPTGRWQFHRFRRPFQPPTDGT